MTGSRRILRIAGAPARLILLGLIALYQATLSGWLGSQCRFFPSCSGYAQEAIRTHGAVKGTLLACWRVARCGPFTAGGVDPVPPARAHGRYDPVIHGGAAR